MISYPETIPIKRYVAIDSHKEYVMVGGMNDQQKWILRPRRVQMSRFRDWARKNLQPGDAVVLETTSNVWDIYDIVASLVSKIVREILIAEFETLTQSNYSSDAFDTN